VVKRSVSMLLLVACGDPPHHPVDAAPEIELDAAPPGLHVRVAPDACSPFATYHVTRSDGTVAATGEGGAEWVRLEVEPGDMLTAVSGREAYSVAGVEPGDEIEFGTPCIGTGDPSGYVTLSWPEYAGAVIYLVSGECGSTTITSTSTTLWFSPLCTGPTATFVVSAVGGPFPGDVLAWTIVEDQVVADGSQIEMSGWLQPHAITLSLAAPPPEQSVYASLWWGLGPFLVPLVQRGESDALDEIVHVPAFGRVLAHGEIGGDGTSQWLTPTASSFSFDPSPALPTLDAVTYDERTGRIAWYPDPGTATDAVVVRLASDLGPWTIVLPPGTTSFTPPDLQNLNVQPGGEVAIFDRPDITSYAQLRALPHAMLAQSFIGGSGILPPSDGRVMEWSLQSATLLVSPHVPPNPPGRADGPGRLRPVDVGRDHP
jgi:hypothetical protein